MKLNKSATILLSVWLSILYMKPSMSVSASESKEYRSNVEAGFYGEYEDPGDDFIADPLAYPEIFMPAEKEKQLVLPQTGEQQHRYLIVSGLVVMLLSIPLFINKEKI